MKLRELQDRVRQEFSRDQPKLSAFIDATSILDVLVRLTVEGVGFHVSATGEICDPRPAPSQPKQQNARWAGGRRRR